MKKLVLLFCICLIFFNSRAQTSYTWNGSTSTNWTTATNWTPNGIPGSTDHVTIVTGSNACILAANSTVINLTITSGTLNLNSFTLNSLGTVVCNGGNCINGTFNSTATSLTFAGTTFGAIVNANVTDLYLNGSTFNNTVTLNRNNTTNIQSNGNNIFNGLTSITNSGTGYLLLTNGSTGRNETFNAPVTFNTTNTGGLYIGYSRNVYFNANVTVNNTAGTALTQIGRTGTVVLNTGITLSCGTSSGGALNLYNINQSGSTPQAWNPGSAGAVNIYGSTLTGSLTVDAGIISAQTSTFSSAVTYNMSGTTGNIWSSGGNSYNGILTVNHSGSGYFGFGNGTADVYNADIYLNNTSSTGGRIIFGNSSNNQFNGNIYVSQSGTTGASGIALGWGGTFPVINMAATKSIFVNGTFSSGYLQLLRLQQSDATPINLNTTGTALVQLQENTFTGPLNIVTPDIKPLGGTYNGTVSFTKTGGGSGNHNSGNLNIFNSTLYLENQSNNGYILLGYNSADQFNDNVTVVSSGSGGISFGWSNGSGTPVLASGKTISIGSGGFSAGYLQLGSFTQLGSAPLTLTLTGTAYFQVTKPNIPCTFNAPVDITAPDIYIQGGTFNNTTTFTKNGGTSNHNSGNQNIFNAALTINQQSTGGYFMLGYNSNDLFNGDIILTNTGNQGIYFGWSSGTGTPTQAAGYSITVGPAGFSGGALNFNTFTQLGSSPLNLNFSGTSASLVFARNSVFNGNITSVTPSVFFNGCTFNGTVNATKTGVNNDASSGANTFNATCIFENTGSGYLLFGNGNPDVWNNDVTFTNSGSNVLYVAHNSANNLINGNITVNSLVNSTGIQFCSNAASTATLAAGKTIYTGTFNKGYLALPRFTQLGTAPVNLTLATGASYIQYGPSSLFGGNVTSLSPGLFFNGCIFNGTTDCTKNGTSGDYSSGGNIFNGTSFITNSGNSFLLLGNTNPDVWNNDVTFTNNGSERILPCWATSGNLFNGNIYVNTSGSAQGIQFCGANSTASATLAATKTIASGTIGLTSGYLQLKQFTQLGSAPISLTLSPTASYLQYGPSSSLGGNVTSVSPRIFFNGCTFNGTTNCTKNGAGNDDSNGLNTFTGTSIMTNSGSGYLLFGNVNQDVFSSDLTVNNIGTNHVYLAHNSNGNSFNGNLILNNTPISGGGIYLNYYNYTTNYNGNIVVNSTAGNGVRFGEGTGSAVLASGKTISIGSTGFSSGTLLLKQFTQLGSTPQLLPQITGTGILTLGPGSQFNGNVDFNFPQVYLHGTTYNGTATIQKNGATDNSGNGGNIFNGTTVITNSGSGYLLTGSTNADQFNGITTFNNTGSHRIYLAHNHSGQTTTFAQATTLNSAKTGGSDSWSYFISEGSNSNVSFNDLTLSVSGALQSNCRILQGAGTTATYNGNLSLNVSNTQANTQIQWGNSGTSVYNGNIAVTNTGGANGIYFNTNASATSTLSTSKTISIGAGGFSAGTLSLPRFTQLGSTPQNLVLTGTITNLTFGPSSVFNGDVTTTSPTIYFTSNTFNGFVNSTKTGTANDASPGGNTFNGTTTLTNNGTGYFLMANSSPDAYNSHVIFSQNASGIFYPNHNTNCTYAGNITVNSTASNTITFGQAGGGIATLTGGNAQLITKSGTAGNPVFTRLVIAKSGSDVTLNTKINVSSYLTLTQGIINTTQTTILNMLNAATTTIGSSLSYINGPMDYEMALNGARVLNFPIGKATDWRPAILKLTHSNGTSYTYNSEVFNASANALGWTLPTSVTLVSLAHYWDIARRNTATAAITPTLHLSGNQAISLYYDANDGVTDPANLVVCKNTYTAPTTWIDIGGTGATLTSGNVTSTSASSPFNSFSRFTLGNNKIGTNPLPIELLYFTATLSGNTVSLDWGTSSELNNKQFDIERSADGVHFEYLSSVKAHGNGNSVNRQTYHTVDKSPLKGTSYYRLKQVDKTEVFKYADLVSVELKNQSFVHVFPNPASNKLYITNSENYSNATIKIMSATGVEVTSMAPLSSYDGSIDISSLPSGIYFIAIHNQLVEQTIKISVIK